MIDKVEVRIPAQARFSKEFESLYVEIRNEPKLNPFHGSHHYQSVGDLRKFGHDAILHMHCAHGKNGNHKLELLDTGTKSYAAMWNQIERMFDIDPGRLPLMRVDLAADVRGVSVDWFSRHARARWKRWVCDMGSLEYVRMGRQRVQTYYLGKRPNLFRIYDKVAEYRHQYAQRKQRESDAADLPSFEEAYGVPEAGTLLTRVERQIGGGRLPDELATFGRLRESAEFNPFDRLELSAPGVVEPCIENYKPMVYLAGIGARTLIDEQGLQRLRALLNGRGGNAARILDRLREFLPAGPGITSEHLYVTFRESVQRQIAA